MKKNKKEFSMHNDYHAGGELTQLNEHDAAELNCAEEPDQKKAPEVSEQVDQVVQGLSGTQIGGQVYMIDVRQLDPYPDQPFRQYPPAQLQELADDIVKVGILSPILARRNGSKLQILAGHNRWSAAKLAGLSRVPVLILDVDDDQAILVLTSTNLRQREHLLPGEKAFAYKMQMDALRRQGQRSGADDEPYNAAHYITQQTGDSRMQIHRYIRLTYLEPGILELLDKGKISMTPAVAVSYLNPENQREALKCIREYGAGLTIEKANRLKDMALTSGDSPLPEHKVTEILCRTLKDNKSGSKFVIEYERIRQFLPGDLNAKEAEQWIIDALEAYNKRSR